MSAYRDGAVATWVAYAIATLAGLVGMFAGVVGMFAGESWLWIAALLWQVTFYGGLILGCYIERRNHPDRARPLYTLGVKPALMKTGIEPDDWERVVPYNPSDSDCAPVKGHHPRIHRVGPNSLAITCSCSCGWKPSGQDSDTELAMHLAAARVGLEAT